MSQQGAALQTYNNELVKCLEELCERRGLLQREIDEEEREKKALEAKMAELRSRLDRADQSLRQKLAARDKFDKTIAESEQAYCKILESSQVLLSVVKKDSKSLLGEGNEQTVKK